MRNDDYILGIETSCDETAAAVVQNGREIISNVVASQIDIHALYGGVVPEIASREHIKAIVPVTTSALREAGIGADDLSAVAVTHGPGLIGALLVGVSFAKALAASASLPLVPIHHLEGHIASCYLADRTLEPPFLCLVVSGGHAHLVAVRDYTNFEVLGRTRDDAPGEAFDKVARVLGLGYPGGPLIDRAAQGADDHAFELPVSRFEDSFDFSFSGLKTAAIQQYERFEREAKKKACDWTELCRLEDFAATFQAAVVRALTSHLEAACLEGGFDTVALAGGVSANSSLRNAVDKLGETHGLKVVVPDLSLCTDNAAMIASAGYYAFRDGRRADPTLNAYSILELDRWQDTCDSVYFTEDGGDRYDRH